MKKSVWLILLIIILASVLIFVLKDDSKREGVLLQDIIQIDGIPLEDVYVTSIEEREWPDSCLGLAREGEICAQVIVPGYEITFDYQGVSLTYRTNTDGSIARIDHSQ